MPLHPFGALLEGHEGAHLRHLPEGVGPGVEAVSSRDHAAVPDWGTPWAVDRHACWWLREDLNQEIDPVHLIWHHDPSPPDVDVEDPHSTLSSRRCGRRNPCHHCRPLPAAARGRMERVQAVRGARSRDVRSDRGTSPEAVLEGMIRRRLLAVIRTKTPEQALAAAEAVAAGGILSLEVSVTMPDADQVIKALAPRHGDR